MNPLKIRDKESIFTSLIIYASVGLFMAFRSLFSYAGSKSTIGKTIDCSGAYAIITFSNMKRGN